MSIRGGPLFPLAVVLFLLPLCGGTLFAFGQRESQLATAQQLINQKKYNEAILVITRVMKEKPQEFDRAQALLEQIDKARNAYNELLAELIKVFNEGNLEEAYRIIKELEVLDRTPSHRTLEAQAYARQMATYVHETKQFQALMDKALAMLKSSDYTGAVTTYLSGFDLGYDQFKQANYGNIVTDRVESLRSDIQSSSEEFMKRLDQVDAQRTAINADLDQPAVLSTQVEGVITSLRDITALHSRIEKDTTNLKIQQESVVFQRSSVQSIPLISFLERLVYGRADATAPEGILAAINEAWDNALGAVHGELQNKALADFAAARASYASQQWNQASGGFASAKTYALLAERAAAAWGIRIAVGSSLTIPQAGWSVIERRLPDALDDQIIAQAADSYASLISQGKALGQINSSDTSVSSLRELAAERQGILKIVQTLRSGRTTWTGRKEHYGSLQASKLDVSSAVNRIDGMISAFDDALAQTDQATVEIVAREGSLRLAPVSNNLAGVRSTVEKAAKLIEGVPPANKSGVIASTLKEKYPGQAKQLLTEAQKKLSGYSEAVSSATGFLSQAGPSVLQAPSVKQLVSVSNRLSSQISGISDTVKSSLQQADQQIFQASRYQQEGENELQRARNDLAQRSFASARQQIAAAASSFDKSLSYQENPAVRKTRDGELPRLSAQITDAENAIVVHDVRDYINRGRQLYTQGDYARAQDMFLRADSRWRITNTESNPEITTWLKYVDTALSINSGRVVAPTDPLYPEITQVLNLAQKDYEQGKQLIARGDTAKAKTILADAQTKLIYVQIPFPLNKEARVLALRILQLTDPNTFAATFKQKYDQAVAELKSNPQDAYISFKDLQAIYPAYHGLSAEIYRAEILAGMRRPPPDPAKIRESGDLYQKAFDIVRQNVRAQYPIAISYLNRAIELNPSNQQATALKDRLVVDEGGATTVVMSSGDQVQFKLAQEQFIAKNYYEALRIVNQLLKVPANENYSPLLELKRRIESKI